MHIPWEVSADLVSYINAGLPAACRMAKRTAISASLAGKLFAGLVFLRVVGSRFIREIVLHDFFFFSFRRSRESDSEMAINIKRELPGLWASVSWISASTVRSPQGTTGTEDWKMDWFASCSPAEGPWSVLPSSFPSRHRKLLLSRCCSCFLVTPPSHSCGRLNHETEQKRKCYSYEMN